MKLFPSRFYAIVDPVAGHRPAALAKTLLESGVRVIQLRLKEWSARDFAAEAERVVALCRDYGALLIVNDRADIAALVDAAGVHVGQEDLPLPAARRVVGPNRIVGVSTHSVEQAQVAEEKGADYIGFGPLFPGGVKQNPRGQGLERLAEVRRQVRIPIVAIGGITAARVKDVLEAGADAVAIISDVVRAPDVAAKAREILTLADGAGSGAR